MTDRWWPTADSWSGYTNAFLGRIQVNSAMTILQQKVIHSGQKSDGRTPGLGLISTRFHWWYDAIYKAD